MEQPRLRTVNKSIAPFPLNHFPSDLPYILGEEIVYLLTTKGLAVLEGPEFERIFAHCIGAQWKPSNVGLDDIVLGNTAWGAKSVKAKKPSTISKIRLISGRNAPNFSYGKDISSKHDPLEVGEHILGIWNARVSAIREKYENLRTVVLIKSDDLSEVALFEYDTIRYEAELYDWKWVRHNENAGENLIGFIKKTNVKKFTWQPSGAQFTIHQEVTSKRLIIKIRKPPILNRNDVLKVIDFNKDWITVNWLSNS